MALPKVDIGNWTINRYNQEDLPLHLATSSQKDTIHSDDLGLDHVEKTPQQLGPSTKATTTDNLSFWALHPP